MLRASPDRKVSVQEGRAIDEGMEVGASGQADRISGQEAAEPGAVRASAHVDQAGRPIERLALEAEVVADRALGKGLAGW